MLRAIAFLSVLPAIALPGCGTNNEMCTLIGCASSLEVGFIGANDKAGRYQVELVADGVPSACQITLPHDCSVTPTCSAAELPWRLMLSGCALTTGQRIEGFVFDNRAPTSVDFVVRRDDIAVGGDNLHPQYRESHPNGPECEPVCRTAPRFETAIAP